jgi:acyl dehydratase
MLSIRDIMSTPFDPKQHRVAAPRGFADLKVGETFGSPSRTVSEAHFSLFQALSGDNHPIHYDIEYCRARGYPGLLAHGLQVLAFTAAGAGSFAHVIGDALLGFVEQSAKFLKPVYPGDTLYPELTITALIAQRTTGLVVMAATLHNQRGELVLSGEHKYLLRK